MFTQNVSLKVSLIIIHRREQELALHFSAVLPGSFESVRIRRTAVADEISEKTKQAVQFNFRRCRISLDSQQESMFFEAREISDVIRT